MFLLNKIIILFLFTVFLGSSSGDLSSGDNSLGGDSFGISRLVKDNTVSKDKVLLIEFIKNPSEKEINRLKNISEIEAVELFDDINNEYFKRLYRVKMKKDAVFYSLKSKIKRLSFIKTVEQTQKVSMLTLLPSKDSNEYLKDNPYFNFQWALDNNGQLVKREVDDIHSEDAFLRPGDKKADIGWINYKKWLAKNNKSLKKVIVAVIDSGVDLGNKDLNIALNKTECEISGASTPENPKYIIPTLGVEDKDGNGYAGDCMGWNFSAVLKPDNKTYDDRAHGTHVSGIIAAINDNNFGISGVASNVEILPIKVFRHIDRKEQNKMISGRAESFGTQTDRIAKAILYAIKMKADVINMSFGWPRFADTEHLRQALALAVKNNITLVAGSGNDGHNQLIYPCATKGVICVGAHDIKGEIADFSNYGGHVDLIAPGERVLSLFPKSVDANVYENFFHNSELGIMNGTSQSAPYVTGAVAVLKGLYPGISNDEIYARLSKTTAEPNVDPLLINDTYNLNGMLQLDKAVMVVPSAVIRPVFKEFSQVVVGKKSQSFKFNVLVKNYWLKAKNVKVIVESSSKTGLKDGNDGYILNPKTKIFSSIASGETKSINSLVVKVPNNSVNSKYSFDVSIFISGKLKGKYRHEVNVVSELPERIKSFPLKKLTKALKEAILNSSINTITDEKRKLKFPEYYTLEKNKNGLTIHVLSKDGLSYEEKGVAVIPKASELLSFFVEDVNYDGELDYVVRSVVFEGKEPRYIQFSFLNRSDLKPLYGEKFSHWLRPRNEPALLIKNLRWLGYQDEQMGKVAVPIWVANTHIPKEDLDDNPFNTQYLAGMRLFYLRPVLEDDGVKLEERLLDNDSFMVKLKYKLLTEFYSEYLEGLDPIFKENPEWPMELSIFFNSSFVQSSDCNDKLEVLFSVGKGSKRDFYILKLTGSILNDEKSFTYNKNIFITRSDYQGADLSGNLTNSVIDLAQSPVGFGDEEAFVDTSFSRTPRVSFLHVNDYSKVNNTLIAENESEEDRFVTYVKTYKTKDKYYAFYRTKEALFLKLQDLSNSKNNGLHSIKLVTSSFLPSFYFSEALTTIYFGKKGSYQPALYVDATAIYENSIFSWIFNGKELVAPIKYNFKVPDNCVALNPTRFADHYAYTLLCGDGKTGALSLNYIELK